MTKQPLPSSARATSGTSRPAPVVLVSMPFGPHILQPSMGLSLLKAALASHDVPCEILYFTLSFARRTGVKLYANIAYTEPTIHGFAGEWLFNGCLFPDHDHDVEGYVDGVLRGNSTAFREARHNVKPMDEGVIQEIRDLRASVGTFIRNCADEVLARRPKIVGLTSTFQQHVASLSLARHLKERDTDLFIIMGGANCEGVMGWETRRSFPFVDAVVSGEADLIFPEVVTAVLEGRSLPDVPGLFHGHRLAGLADVDTIAAQTAPSLLELDALPYPDYDDFFAQFEAAGLEFEASGKASQPRIMFETSRGCWWGDKSHCTFCGLNGSNIRYRSKSSRRALGELTYLIDRYPGCDVSVVDNILDMSYFKDFIPQLAERRLGVELFYEIKANLSKRQVRMLRDAGITRIQPGIENLSSHVLGLMHKGIRTIQNLQLLKWCKELGVKPYWNMLYGLPGEEPTDYAEVARLVPLLTHLPPPTGGGIVRLDRFSPNFQQADELGLVNVAPYPAYGFIYPLEPDAVFNMAYFFTFDFRDGRDVQSYIKPVTLELWKWSQSHGESDLFSVEKGDRLLIWDLRPSAPRPLTVLSGALKVAYEASDTVCSLQELKGAVERHSGEPVAEQDLVAALDQLVGRGLMYHERRSYLSLATPLGEYSPPAPVLTKLREIVGTMGTVRGDNLDLQPARGVESEVVPMR